MKVKYRHAAVVILSLLVVKAQPALGTKSIPTDTSIGTWDPGARIYTLTTDVYETIRVDQDNLTLDGAGYTVTVGPSLDGVYVPGRTSVTIRNVNVWGCYTGIYISGGSWNTMVNNAACVNAVGIWLRGTSNSIVTTNSVSTNRGGGIYLFYSDDSSVENNAVYDNNVAISLLGSSRDTVRGSTISDNKVGAALWYSNDNLIYNNNFIDNTKQIFDDAGTGNVFNKPAPEGGNYWSDHAGPDADNDGFVDAPYVICDYYGVQIGQDDLPWTYEDRWLRAAAKEATEVLVGQVLELGLPKGFAGKLNNAIKILGDANPNNDSVTVNKLDDFIGQVNNNQDNISDAGGDPVDLVTEAESIIAILEGA